MERLQVEQRPFLFSTSSLPAALRRAGEDPLFASPPEGDSIQHVARAPRRSLEEARIGIGAPLGPLRLRPQSCAFRQSRPKPRGGSTPSISDRSRSQIARSASPVAL